ncbi:plasma-membrane proton-efflux P-type ATPase [Candidatus Bathyarchaeota archaeon A05DMB-2]|nr:plasma-membrane proton-efflux P-type ATPase [Candidatus Bathyarchaeota archaeon A05DMB-2]
MSKHAYGESVAEKEDAESFQKAKTDEVLKILQSNSEKGLTNEEVEKRLKLYGYNEVPQKKANPYVRFAKKFWGLTAWMLEAIIILSWFLQRYADLCIVTGLLVFNAVLAFTEEQKASSAVDTLQKKLQVSARTLRDEKWRTLPSRELVPGDIVRVRAGDFVPADVKVVDGTLEVDQSALTGESAIIEKKTGDMLYSGSIIKRGESTGIVVLTGTRTYFGRTAQLVQIAKPKMHIETVISNVVRWLLIIVLALIALALVFSVLEAKNLFDLLPIILVLLLSAIPVALPAMFTVSMAVGSMELAKKGVLVTRLSASEDAATMDVLCVDKTGTITMNQLSVAKRIPLNEFSEKDVILYGALASQEANQDPIDLAFITKAKEQNLFTKSYAQKNFTPFDPATRRTEATIKDEQGNEFKVMKGAVHAVVHACGYDEKTALDLEEQVEEFAAKGYRTLAVAKTDAGDQPKLVGLVALYDLPRPDSKQLITELGELGVSVKMLTGDALPIAKEIAKDVGLGENVMKASHLEQLKKQSPLEAAEAAEKSSGFAEIYPEGKYTIVKSLQATKHIVGMTGDGVNDAPALRQAEVGIAVSNATDVAKGAASVVLTREGLTSIVDLIENGRTIYERITAWILSKIVRTLQIATFVVISFLLTGDYVVSAFAVILYFFATDFVKLAMATDNQTWSQKPNTWNVANLVKVSLALSLLVIAESFALLYLGIYVFDFTVESGTLYTYTFEILFYSAMFLIFNVRERRHFWNSKPSRTLAVAIILSVVAVTLMTAFGIPGLALLPITTTLSVLALSSIFALVLNDSVKVALVRNAKISW